MLAASSGSQSKPVFPSSIKSGTPPTFAATTGTPAAAASSTIIGQLSSSDGSANSAAFDRSATGRVRKTAVLAPGPLLHQLQEIRGLGIRAGVAEENDFEFFLRRQRVERADEGVLVFPPTDKTGA